MRETTAGASSPAAIAVLLDDAVDAEPDVDVVLGRGSGGRRWRATRRRGAGSSLTVRTAGASTASSPSTSGRLGVERSAAAKLVRGARRRRRARRATTTTMRPVVAARSSAAARERRLGQGDVRMSSTEVDTATAIRRSSTSSGTRRGRLRDRARAGELDVREVRARRRARGRGPRRGGQTWHERADAGLELLRAERLREIGVCAGVGAGVDVGRPARAPSAGSRAASRLCSRSAASPRSRRYPASRRRGSRGRDERSDASCKRLESVGRSDDRVAGALEPQADEHADVGVVVRDQDERLRAHSAKHRPGFRPRRSADRRTARVP